MIYGKKRVALRKFRLIVTTILTVFLLLGAVTLTAFGVAAAKQFQTDVPRELFAHVGSAVPPKFYRYRFTDREGRVGTEELISEGVGSVPENLYVPYGEFPEDLIHAVVAIEDKRFFEHGGVDWKRTLSAGIHYFTGKGNRFGASTITQQLVKNVTGNNEISWKRKFQELLYAKSLERNFTKEEILEKYLNILPLANGCVGVGAGAWYYFSKTPPELSAAECASLAAITNNPAYYDPVSHPENNLERRDLILSEMHAQGYLDDGNYEAALAEPLRLQVAENKINETPVRSWYLDMVVEDVITDLCSAYGMSRDAASSLLNTGGLRIDTAMDAEMQELVEQYYAAGLRTPTNAKGEHAQSALILIDGKTGDILAVAGAVGEKTANRVQNYATQTKRAPGSAIKPISVYGPALQTGKITWSSVYDDVPLTFEGKLWPKNAVGYYRGLTNIPFAVAHSTNTVALRVLDDIGLETSYQYAKEKFHLSLAEGKISDKGQAALGLGQLNYGITLRELTDAYTVFADGGIYHPYRSYFRVLDEKGNLLLNNPDRREQVLSEENAAIMTKLLQGVMRDGTSSSVTLGRICECAGKTGTTQNDHDRWFVGYTPDLICGVWCGYEYPEPLVGRNLCTSVWNTVMHAIVAKGKTGKTFPIPNGIVQATYCKDSGLLPSASCDFDPRGSRLETGWFIRGTEPKSTCNCHVLCEVDAEEGGVCHVHTPGREQETVALIRVERHFPKQVVIADAQYVWRGDPAVLPPNPDPSKAYFDLSVGDFCGESQTDRPFNRSFLPPEDAEEDELPPIPWDYEPQDE